MPESKKQNNTLQKHLERGIAMLVWQAGWNDETTERICDPICIRCYPELDVNIFFDETWNNVVFSSMVGDDVQ